MFWLEFGSASTLPRQTFHRFSVLLRHYFDSTLKPLRPNSGFRSIFGDMYSRLVAHLKQSVYKLTFYSMTLRLSALWLSETIFYFDQIFFLKKVLRQTFSAKRFNQILTLNISNYSNEQLRGSLGLCTHLGLGQLHQILGQLSVIFWQFNSCQVKFGPHVGKFVWRICIEIGPYILVFTSH